MKFHYLFLSLIGFGTMIGAKHSPLLRKSSGHADFTKRAGLMAPMDRPGQSNTVYPLTNAERLRQGLPIISPRKPSRVAARAAVPSPTPCGRLVVEDVDGAYKGYIASSLDSQGRFFLTLNRADALEVVYNHHRLIPTNSAITQPVVGVTFGETYQNPPGSNAFDVGSYNFAVLSPTSETVYGFPASPGLTSYTGASVDGIESAIFRIDHKAGNEIIPTWINPDGSPVRSSFVVPSEDDLRPVAITGGIDAYKAMFGGYAARVFCDAN
ncbi:SubName: Full=Uncharacterized protein {ECO:0000313/EMBL:CCA66723.1} [Serendipita indica DSM 11827]|uniref:Uncharacterized protein n=1 Tax=Serendipita indica (strain DSM 11827) TaxID=1109443 RepID=G4T5X2_SERID|nr:SubName: Full=Uncharacterized protein {ECO:0000313/EMBL:CCA66723.1} [Serendipita indica DSM 11827]CCA66723.1 hypothetical protein PIIN_00404 [Serendipita indica DSM 11827]